MSDNPYANLLTNEDKQAKYQELLLERRKAAYAKFMPTWMHHRKIQMKLDSKRHTIVATLAAGSFGISFAFIGFLIDIGTALNIIFLLVSWCMFVSSALFIVLELVTGAKVQDMLLDNVEENLLRSYDGREYKRPNRFLTRFPTRFLGALSTTTYVMGVICLMVFTLQNLL